MIEVAPPPSCDHVASLIEAHSEFTRLLNHLGTLQRRRESTRRYLSHPGSNAVMGQACLRRIDAERNSALARLRTSRQQAHRLLGIGEAADLPFSD
jgi:hypothetical protein